MSWPILFFLFLVHACGATLAVCLSLLLFSYVRQVDAVCEVCSTCHFVVLAFRTVSLHKHRSHSDYRGSVRPMLQRKQQFRQVGRCLHYVFEFCLRSYACTETVQVRSMFDIRIEPYKFLFLDTLENGLHVCMYVDISYSESLIFRLFAFSADFRCLVNVSYFEYGFISLHNIDMLHYEMHLWWCTCSHTCRVPLASIPVLLSWLPVCGCFFFTLANKDGLELLLKLRVLRWVSEIEDLFWKDVSRWMLLK